MAGLGGVGRASKRDTPALWVLAPLWEQVEVGGDCEHGGHMIGIAGRRCAFSHGSSDLVTART